MDGLMSLLSETEFQGLKIKEWNIVQFSKLSGTLNEIAKEYKARNVSFGDFASIFDGVSESGMLDLSQNVLELIEPFTKRAPLLLGVSCGLDAKALDALDFTTGIVAVMLVMKANMEHLQRFFVKLAASPSIAAEATTALTPSSSS